MKAYRLTTDGTLTTLLLVLAGCGGGGGGEAPVAPITSFALQAGLRAKILSGSSDNFAISGTCSGTSTVTVSGASASTFEGIAGYSSVQTQRINYTNCTPASSAVTGTNYYDINYATLGSSVLGLEYSKVQSVPPPLPTTVKVGDTALYATLNVYTDATKTTITGQRQLSYVVESDSATTAFITLISKGYNNSSQLLFTQQSKYRIAGDGTLTIVAIDIQYSTTSTAHLVFTKT